jgi:hypothetical protein
MPDTFQLVFRGEVLAGFEPVEVMARVAHTLGTDPAGMAELFSGRPVVLQRGVDGTRAHRYALRFAQLGARLAVEPDGAAVAAAPAPATPPPSAPNAAGGYAFGRRRRHRPTADGAALWGWRLAGRLGRQPYARAGIAAAALQALAAAFLWQDPTPVRAAVAGAAWGLATLLALRWTVLRLHDAGRPARWAALVALPGAGVLAGGVLALLPSQRGTNAHGPEPRRGRAWVTLGVATVVALALGAALWAVRTQLAPLKQQLRGRAAAAFNGHYQTAAQHKAFALSPAGAWGWRSGLPSRSAAVYEALATCERNRRPASPPCRVIDIDGAPPRPED